MKKVIRYLIVILFVMAGLGAASVVYGQTACSEGYVCTVKDEEVCNAIEDAGYQWFGCLQIQSGIQPGGGYLTGNCCEPENSEEPTVYYPPCDSGLSCVSISGPDSVATKECVDRGGVNQTCQDGEIVGTCCLPSETECPTGFVCSEVTTNCSGFGDPIRCGPGRTLGCCIDTNREVEECAEGFTCRSSCMRIPTAEITNCGPNGATWCCVPGGDLDEGQTACDSGYGCQDKTESECSALSGGNRSIAYVESCGTVGSVGCCVNGAEDEEFRNDPTLPDPIEFGEPMDRDFLPEFFKTWDLETQTANIYNLVFPIGIFISIAMIIVAGYGYLTSTGNPDKVRDASGKLTSAVTGAVFIILSLAILKVIINSLLGSYIP